MINEKSIRNLVQKNWQTENFTMTRLYGGSDRAFWRVKLANQSVVILCDDDRDEIKRYAILLKYLRKNGISVPTVIRYDSERGIIIMEDAGDLSLYKSVSQFNELSNYWLALDELAKIHSLNPPDNADFLMPPFGFPDFIYETQYFVRHFLIGFCGFDENLNESLLDEFYFLAQKADQSPRSLMHRDFQSKNIILKDSYVRVIDFQGARIGPRAYDLASLLEDPYTLIPEEFKRKLFEKYIASIEKKSVANAVKESYPYNAIQRLLQATAAFSYLAFVKGKSEFSKFILPALQKAKQFTDLEQNTKTLHKTLEQALTIARKKLRQME